MDWRKGAVGAALVAGMALLVMYEIAVRVPSRESSKDLKDDKASPKAQDKHLDFMTTLHAAKQAAGPDFTLADVKKEFKDKYADKGKSLLCSACKIAATRINDELHARKAADLPEPVLLLNATVEAIQASCEDIPERLYVEPGSRRGTFVFEEHDKRIGLTTMEMRRAEVARKGVQRLCEVALHDAKWDMLQALIRHKVPHLKHTAVDNWERWLCERHARVCRHAEVEDDDEDEEGEL